MATRRSRRLALAAGLVLMSALSLTACGDDASTDEGSTDGALDISAIDKDDAIAALVPAGIASDGKILVGTDASYPPNEFIGEDGTTIEGFSVDLGQALGRVLGLEFEFENSPFDGIIPGIQSKKYEMGLSSFTANAERQEVVDFATYFIAGTEWATKSGNPEGVDADNACGKTIAVQKGTVQVEDIEARSKACTEADQAAIDIQQYQQQTEATTAVVSGKADGMLADLPVIIDAVGKSGGQLESLAVNYDSAPYGIALPKSEGDYAQAIQQAVQSLIDSGDYAKILEKWNVASGAIESSEINPA
jgi:polar amino acid transport system substrate-binding protein